MAKSEYIDCPKCKTNEHVEEQISQYSAWVTCTKCGRRTQAVGFGFCSPLANWNSQEPRSKGYRKYFYYEGQEFDSDEKGARMTEALAEYAPGHKDGDMFLYMGRLKVWHEGKLGECQEFEHPGIDASMPFPLNRNIMDVILEAVKK